MHQKLHSIDQNHEVSCGLRLKRKLLHYVFEEDKNVCAVDQSIKICVRSLGTMIANPGVTCINFFWVCAAGLSVPLNHYSLANYRPHLSHFWVNM